MPTPMRYDSSMYRNGGPSNGPYNITNAQSAYFANTTPSSMMNAPQAAIPGAAPNVPGDQPQMGAVDSTPMEQRGLMGKPSHWWVMLVIIAGVFIFVSRKFGGPEKFGNIKLTFWNGIFAVIFYVIILNFLKVVFEYWKVPGLTELVRNA